MLPNMEVLDIVFRDSLEGKDVGLKSHKTVINRVEQSGGLQVA